MQYVVVRSFPFAKDGLNAKILEVNSTVDLTAEQAAGLLAEGFISGSKPEVKKPLVDEVHVFKQPVEEAVEIATSAIETEVETDTAPVVSDPSDPVAIPDDWRTFRVADLKELAAKVSGREVDTVGKARQIIEDELESRK